MPPFALTAPFLAALFFAPLAWVASARPPYSQDLIEEGASALKDSRIQLGSEPKAGLRESPFFWGQETSPIWPPVFGPPGGSQDFRLGFLWEGSVPFERNSKELFFPASTMKLWTAFHALESLGADYRFESQLQWMQSPETPGIAWNVVLIGDGDPSWGMSELGEPQVEDPFIRIAHELSRAGIHEVRGLPRALAADERWESIHFPSGWREEDRIACFGAQP